MEKSRKILIILFGHLWVVELTYIYIFAFKFTLRWLQPDIIILLPVFATGVNDTGGKFEFETVYMEYSGAGGKLIHEKN